MKKKNLYGITAIVLSAIMAAGSLTGCGRKMTEAAAEPAAEGYYGEAEESEASAACETPAAVDQTDSSAAYDAGLCDMAPTASIEEECTADANCETAQNQTQQSSQKRSYAEYDILYHNHEEYTYTQEEGFKSVEREPLSTFSADVDTASYSNIRRMIHDGYSLYDIPSDAVRIEEMINYFDYDYKEPTGNDPFSITTEIGDCPWNEEAKLMLVGMQTKKMDFSDAAPSNLVFLLDVSGSMYSDDKLPLLQKAFSMLTANLTRKDRVSIVTYAGSDAVILEGVRGNDYDRIIDAINNLEAGGSTAGSAGIMTAYEIAEDYFIEGGNNRVILATDGDLNVGLTSEDELENLITKEKETGVFLSVLGFGTGNLKDNKMELLADKGNGNYHYIDSSKEAKKVLVEEMGATLVTVAKDVKFQVEFNPIIVKEYRLIGYDNRIMAAEDFTDDKKDAGEVGAGHSVTALYEIITADDVTDSHTRKGSIHLKYQDEDYEYEKEDTDSAKYTTDEEWLTVSVRYKEPDGSTSKLTEHPVDGTEYTNRNSDNWLFASAVAEFGMILKNSEYQEDASFRKIQKLLDQADIEGDEYKEEFQELIDIVRGCR